MATVNLGRIKPVFRGAYSGSTAYVVDDIVTSGGSSYICIQAHGAGTQAVNQTAYWTQMAAGGTDVGTTITTQGDILYRDGSGLQRLAKGTAGQVLKMNSGASAPEWGTDQGGKIGQVISTHKADSFSTTNGISGSNWTEVTGLSTAITPSATSSKIWITGSIMVSDSAPNRVYIRLYRGSTSIGQASDSGLSSTEVHKSAYHGGTTSNSQNISINFLDTPNTTSATTYKIMICHNQADSASTTFVNRHNNSASGVSDDHQTSQITLMEVLA